MWPPGRHTGIATSIDGPFAHEADMPIDVYNMQGVLLLRNVTRAEAADRLPTGFYIMGRRKVLLR
ncbi:MAG: hypothetical protein SO006_01870 [Muribaculaceae bacterium]|nr:hypothetical protein [Muribaculaceae bacterium]